MAAKSPADQSSRYASTAASGAGVSSRMRAKIPKTAAPSRTRPTSATRRYRLDIARTLVALPDHRPPGAPRRAPRAAEVPERAQGGAEHEARAHDPQRSRQPPVGRGPVGEHEP